MKGKKTGGRKSGSKNRVSKEFKETLDAFIENKFPAMEKAFDKLTERDKVNAYLKFIEFRIPKLSSLPLDAEKVPESYLDEMIKRIESRKATNAGETEKT